MKPCDKHWAMMRKAVEARGMTHLVKGSVENHANIVKELEGEPDKQFFDPLMNMYWAVTNQALSYWGLYLMGTTENGDDYCPICEAMLPEHICKCGEIDCPVDTPEKVEFDWVNGPADAQLGEALKRGLITRN